jgi:transglutaminase-like putative cysteine protease
MRVLLKNYLAIIAVVCFLPGAIMAVTGEIVNRYATPGSCPTGLAFDGKNIWLADRKSDSLYKIDRLSGNILESQPAPGYQVEGLAWEKDHLWLLDVEEGEILRLNPGTQIVDRAFPAPCARPQELAWDGQYLWVADYRGKALYQISTDDGTTIKEIPAPSVSSYGLAYDGHYLWVADRFDDKIYMVYPENGDVILTFGSPANFPRGLAFDGEYLWNVDYQTDSLYQIRIHDDQKFSATDGKKEELELTHQFRNYGPGEVIQLEIYLALPHDLPSQKLLDSLTFTPQPSDFKTDRWGQKVARFHYENLLPGRTVSVTMKAKAELYKTRYFVFPEKAGTITEIPDDVRKQYLGNDTKYWVNDPYIQKTACEVVGDEKNCYWIARRLFDYLIDKMEYELVGGWNVAPTVLKRGTGSCSEYSFVYIALCRASGLPARYAGSVAVRGDDASTDDVFHRWVEVFLPHYGWIPVDPSGGDSKYPAAQASAFGYLNNCYLITTLGGGSSEYLEWNYNSNETWQSRGPCKTYSECIGEWSPLIETGN